ncbi:MAG: DUF4199 domain-containing protein [Flavobacteriaceae bacterium]|nr:DUF4199 domain-containing protein [Flavobacteriaceae bacterium]
MHRFKLEIKWAFIFMLALLLWMELERAAGLHDRNIHLHQYLTMLYVIPAVWIYVLALKDIKKKYYKGVMNFKQGLVSGLMITLVVAVFSPLLQWIISFVITPDYFNNVIEYSLQTGYMESRTAAEAHFNFKSYALSSVMFAIVSGIITSLLVAFFVKTKNKPTLEQ